MKILWTWENSRLQNHLVPSSIDASSSKVLIKGALLVKRCRGVLDVFPLVLCAGKPSK